MNSIRETVLRDPFVSRVFGTGLDAYLVGGYVRDLLRGVKSNDMDFVVKGDVRRLVPELYPDGDVSIIEFRNAMLVRVVKGDYTLDFSELKGELRNDLVRRDFSMNAVAWSPQTGIIDPLKGVSDIRKGLIRGISEKNFLDDPLRLLRAYRFASELQWKIDVETRGIIRKLKKFIHKSATERITLELFRMVNADGHLKALQKAFTDGLLEEIIAINTDYLQNNIKVLSRLNAFLKRIPEEWRAELDLRFSQGLLRKGILRAEQLLFRADLEESRLSLSTAILKRLLLATRFLNAIEKNRNLRDSQVYDLFTEAGDAVKDLVLLSRRQRFLKTAERFMRIPRLMSSENIMEVKGIGPGSELGRILYEMKRQQFLGKIKDEKDALKWLAVTLESNSSGGPNGETPRQHISETGGGS